MITRTRAAAVLVLLLLSACEQPPPDEPSDGVGVEEARQARESLSPAVVEALDAANDAYEEEDYARALELYRQANAAAEDGEVAAAWFGIYMAELALGNKAAADRAMERARALAPEPGPRGTEPGDEP